MASEFDTKLGQLAIARGWISLSELIGCVEKAGRDEEPLASVLMADGFISEGQFDKLHQKLQQSDEEAIQTELEKGETIVIDEIAKARETDISELKRTAGGSPPSTGGGEASSELGEMDLSLDGQDRYDIEDELGRGGMGQVFLARDKILNRKVALKKLLPDAQTAKGESRLLLEAQVTGLLEHPNIAPVYDLRAMSDGQPFYTMRVVQERSLEEVLGALRRGEDTDISLTQLISVLRQVSLAIQYAHDLGVVHRDLKPENILLGKYGEVYVIDWGIAKLVKTKLGIETADRVDMGALVGTPQYMAPEQARGDNEAVDERTDVYALGAILFEILTLEPVFDARHVLSLLFMVVNEPAPMPSERAEDRKIPAELEEICMRAIAKAPEERYQSAQEFADELELFLEGVKERERRLRLAHAAMESADQSRAVYEDVRESYARLSSRLSEERRQIKSWAPPEEKEPLWALEQDAEDMQVEIERRFGEAIRAYGQALVHVPEMPEARRALADLYWQRFREAELTGNRAEAAYFEGLVRHHNDGAYDTLLEGQATLSLGTNPQGAAASLFRYEQVNRRLMEWEVAELGTTPLNSVTVSHGSYMVKLELEGHRPLSYPILLDRVANAVVDLELYSSHEVPDDFVVIPRGPFIKGEADKASMQRQTVTLDDFAIMRFPVTCGEYLEFLNDLADSNPDEALKHAPRIDEDADTYFPRDDEGKFFLPEEDAEGDRWDPSWPMILVNYFNVSAFAKWRSARDGREYRLPTADEWEKAARGVDGRVYPWGNHFDASFCRMRESEQGKATPAPVGQFEVDRSPYGVMDVAGNVAEWTDTPVDGSADTRVLKGAAYNSIPVMCRLDYHMTSPLNYRHPHYGFRLAMSLGK